MSRGSRDQRLFRKFGKQSANSDEVDEENPLAERSNGSQTHRTCLTYLYPEDSEIHIIGADCTRLNRVDQSWMEKFWMFVDAIQQFALLWSLSQPWPWPRTWLSGTRWVVFMNLDIVSGVDAAMAVTGPGAISSPWGELRGYVWWGLLYAIVPVTIFAVWLFRVDLILLRHHIIQQGAEREKVPTCAVRNLVSRFENALLRGSHVFHLPIILGIARLFICDDDGTLSVDPNMSCTDPILFVVSSFAVTVGALFMLYLGHETTRAVYSLVIYQLPGDHERDLQRMEMEYVLGLSTTWAESHVWLTSSFRRHAIYFR